MKGGYGKCAWVGNGYNNGCEYWEVVKWRQPCSYGSVSDWVKNGERKGFDEYWMMENGDWLNRDLWSNGNRRHEHRDECDGSQWAWRVLDLFMGIVVKRVVRRKKNGHANSNYTCGPVIANGTALLHLMLNPHLLLGSFSASKLDKLRWYFLPILDAPHFGNISSSPIRICLSGVLDSGSFPYCLSDLWSSKVLHEGSLSLHSPSSTRPSEHRFQQKQPWPF